MAEYIDKRKAQDVRENVVVRMGLKNMPCVYWREGDKCSKFTDDEYYSFCVLGPCPFISPSKSDKIRSMSDEELAKYLWSVERHAERLTAEEWLDWLRQEVEE